MIEEKTPLETKKPALSKGDVSGSGIEWEYFFGSRGGKGFNRYYAAEINGKRVEKNTTNAGSKFAIGNIDEAKKKYKTEVELSKACFA